jgi:hypothetical protein
MPVKAAGRFVPPVKPGPWCKNYDRKYCRVCAARSINDCCVHLPVRYL